MKTIISYLDNMFASLPKTMQMQQLKEEIEANMADKYNELKDEGKSENEAIGIVISEFGNIEELINEFDITFDKDEEKRPTLENEVVNDYLKTSKKSGVLIGIGVGLCVYGVALLILLTQLVEDGIIAVFSDEMGDVIGLIPLLLFVATAVGLFIYVGMMEDKFKYLDNGFKLSIEQQRTVKDSNDAFHKTYTKSISLA
ncbi:permease prefix domain 1-containing protein [Paraliobacillus sediminis]|uniref:permease prefix domain 1-containing protein n=1 Tax=Paraliobacillus sediminis TaxID=1885916 RepID=UPI001F07A55B|nr:permease prefix domain 1-containing protein [Paraliobacillus sediminis]